LEVPMHILAGEFLGIGARLRMRGPIGVALQRDGRYRDHRKLGEFLLQIVKLRLAFSETEPPAIVVNDDGDMIWIVEGRSAAIEGGVVECPLRRRDLPDEFRKLVAVFFVTGATTFGGEVKLIPPFEFGLRRQRYLPGFLAADQIAANRNHGLDTSKNINNI